MNIIRILQLSCFVSSLIFLSGCGAEPANQAELLIGKWDLQSATRNGQRAASLEGLFFEFDEAGNMNTNLPIAKGASTYNLSGSTIKQESSTNNVRYTIESIGDSSLMLSTTLANTDFIFSLKRASGSSTN
jgi:hypothetical protein